MLLTEKSKTIGFVFISLILFSSFAPTPDCSWFFPFRKNLSYELSTFNEKGKLLTRSQYSITSFDSSRTLNTAFFHVKITDKRRRPVYEYNFQAHCHRRGILADVKGFFPPDFTGALEEMYALEEGDVLDFPAKMLPGDSLRGGFYSFVTYVDSLSPTPVLRMSMIVSKRHVVEETSKKIGLGTFPCVKIRSEVRIITNGIPLTYRLEEYVNQTHGIIYAERFGWTGIRTGYTELTKIE